MNNVCIRCLLVFLLLGGCATNPVSYDTPLPAVRETLVEYPFQSWQG